MTWEVQYAGVFTKPTKDACQVSVCPWIGLHLSGFVLWDLPGHEIYLESSGPFIFVLPARTKVHFRAKAPRENWVVFLNIDTIEPASAKTLARVNWGGLSLEVPMCTQVDSATASAMQLEFVRMKDGAGSPLPSLRVMANLALAKVLTYVIEKSSGLKQASPAAELKRLIDLDPMHQHGLSSLARQSGYSLNHLRDLFVRQYGMKPNDYRMKMRMAKALDLIAKSQLSVKEISSRLGFAYLSHFTASFKAVYGFAPTEGIKRFRISFPHPDE